MVLVEPKQVGDSSQEITVLIFTFRPRGCWWWLVLVWGCFLRWNQVGGCGTAEGRAVLQAWGKSNGSGSVPGAFPLYWAPDMEPPWNNLQF